MVLVGDTYKEKYFKNSFYNVRKLNNNEFLITDKENNKGILKIFSDKAILTSDDNAVYFDSKGREIIGMSKKAEKTFWELI